MRNIDIRLTIFGTMTKVGHRQAKLGVGEYGHKKKVALCTP